METACIKLFLASLCIFFSLKYCWFEFARVLFCQAIVLISHDKNLSHSLNVIHVSVNERYFPIGKNVFRLTMFHKNLSIRNSYDNCLSVDVHWAPSTRMRIFLNPQLFLSGYGFRPHVSGVSGRRIRNFLDQLSRVETFESALNLYPETVISHC